MIPRVRFNPAKDRHILQTVEERLAVVEGDLVELADVYDEAAGRVNAYREKISTLFELVRDLHCEVGDIGEGLELLGRWMFQQQDQVDELSNKFEKLSLSDKKKDSPLPPR